MPSHSFSKAERSKRLADRRLDEKMKERQRRIAEYRKVAEESGVVSARLQQIDTAKAELLQRVSVQKGDLQEKSDLSAAKKRRQAWHAEEKMKKDVWDKILKDGGRRSTEIAAKQERKAQYVAEQRRQEEEKEMMRVADARKREVAKGPKATHRREERRAEYAQRTKRGQPLLNVRVNRLLEKAQQLITH